MDQTASPELAQYRSRLVAAGLEAYADALIELARPSVRLLAQRTAESDLPIGSSKIGGRADLPEGWPWPTGHVQPLSFVAQVNLSEVGRFTDGLLPSEGVLSFFYDTVEEPWGFDPIDHGGWAVRYWPASAHLNRRDHPANLTPEGRFGTMRLLPRPEWSFAPRALSEVERLGMTPEEEFTLGDLDTGEDETIHRLLGHPDPIQGDMQLECQLASNGLYCGHSTGYQDPRRAALEPAAVDWRLLFQLDSQDEIDMMWGDVGRLYYWMPRKALANHAWDDAWLILQCY